MADYARGGARFASWQNLNLAHISVKKKKKLSSALIPIVILTAGKKPAIGRRGKYVREGHRERDKV